MIDWELYLTFPYIWRLASALVGLYVTKYAIVFMVAGFEDFYHGESLLKDFIENPNLLTRIVITIFGMGLCILGILLLFPLLKYTGAIF